MYSITCIRSCRKCSRCSVKVDGGCFISHFLMSAALGNLILSHVRCIKVAWHNNLYELNKQDPCRTASIFWPAFISSIMLIAGRILGLGFPSSKPGQRCERLFVLYALRFDSYTRKNRSRKKSESVSYSNQLIRSWNQNRWWGRASGEEWMLRANMITWGGNLARILQLRLINQLATSSPSHGYP